MAKHELNVGYFRSPSIAGDRIVFLCEDDLWSVPADGGVARRLTSNVGPIGRTVQSSDGAYIAFTGTEEAHAEVYVMPADGGPAVRRTYLGSATQVRGWSRDGRVLLQSDTQRANRGDYRIWAIDPDQGEPELINVGAANDLAYAPDGKGIVLGRHTVDPARWKRYRGGTRGDIWIDRTGKGTFQRLLKINSNLASPMWIGDRIFFLSDHEGIGNLYSCTPSGGGIKRHSDHETYYARWAHTDGQRVVYMHGAEIWLCDPVAGTNQRVDIDLRSPRIGRNRRFVDAAKYMHGWQIHPDGHSLAVTTRGKAFTMPLWEQAPRQYGQRDGVRYRLAHWTRDGASLVTISDEGGEEAIEIYDTKDMSRTKRLDRLDIGRAIQMAVSPTDHRVAIANHRNELLHVDLKTGRSKVLDRGDGGRVTGVDWSPDGRYVAYSLPTNRVTRSIRLCEVTTGEVTQVTRPEFYDTDPSFDPGGKYLYFLSYRVFDPVPDSLFFSYGFPRASRPHLVTLSADEQSPFVPQPRGFGPPDRKPNGPEEADAEAAAKSKAARKPKPGERPKPKPVRIDTDGIGDRVVAFPMPEGRYMQVAGIRGKVLFTSFPVSGALGDDIFETSEEPKGKIDVYDLKELKLDTLVGGTNGFRISADSSTMVYQAGRKLRAIRAGEKPNPKPEEEGPGRRTGWVDLSRIRVSVDPVTEYRQMYREAWRFQREHFWTADMSGVDWALIYDRYRPLVEKVASRYEFSDLMWEVNGELGTSHAYEMGGDLKAPPPYRVGHLGADVVRKGQRWVVDHIVHGDSWDPAQTSPLLGPGVNVSVGDAIVAVNGQPTDEHTPPQRLLVHNAGTDVELTITDARGRNRRNVYVKTLVDDKGARYREWVETNRAHVHEATNNRVGYIHIPDMGANGFSEFHRYYFSEVEHDGLLIDVRFNGGGNVSQLLIERLARERIGYDVSRWGKPDPYPSDSPAGPIVCLTNELAGSDGDIFSHVFKLKGLGPVVGKRTWGGVVGITMNHVLVDNGMTTQPEYSFWFKDVGWGVENYGTDPSHDVDITPQDFAKGRDPQMETGLRLIKQALRAHKPLMPDMRTRPHLALPVLPPRGGLPKATKAKASKAKPKPRKR